MKLAATLGALVALLVLASSANAAVSGTWSQSGSTLNISAKNDGPNTISKLRVKLKGARHVSASANPPGTITPTNPTDFDYQPSSPIAPGGQMQIVVNVEGQVTDVIVQESSDGSSFGPEKALARPGGGPGPNPCRCADLKLTPKNVRMELIEDHFQLAFGLDWLLDCTGGPGTTCFGTFKVKGPPQPRDVAGIDLQFKKPKTTVECKSLGNACRDRTGTTPVRLRIDNLDPVRKNPIGKLKAKLGSNPDNGGRPHVFKFKVKRTCGNGKLTDFVIEVVFTEKGNIDRKASDLNGNGKPDRKDR